jgi:hypothetical protein
MKASKNAEFHTLRYHSGSQNNNIEGHMMIQISIIHQNIQKAQKYIKLYKKLKNTSRIGRKIFGEQLY